MLRASDARWGLLTMFVLDRDCELFEFCTPFLYSFSLLVVPSLIVSSSERVIYYMSELRDPSA